MVKQRNIGIGGKMNELKFRAWFSVKPSWCNQMFYSYEEKSVLGDFFSECVIEQSDVVFMQFIDKIDKNSNEVYEKDLLWNKEIDAPLEVFWNKRDSQFSGRYSSDNPVLEMSYTITIEAMKNFEIIGNTLENPELMKYKGE